MTFVKKNGFVEQKQLFGKAMLLAQGLDIKNTCIDCVQAATL